MASLREIEWMGQSAPAGVRDLASVVSQGESPAVSVMGVVIDFLPAARSNGTDYVFTFTICDKSALASGLKIKVFAKSKSQIPPIRENGDVVLLKNLKINVFRGALGGLFANQTQYTVFPKMTVPSKEFRAQYGTRGEVLPHSKSILAPVPTLHQQQWAISLSDIVKHPPISSPPEGPSSVARPSAPSQYRANHERANSTTIQVKASRDKFSLIQDIRCPRGSSGTFYDLVGEVIKMYPNNFGTLELYICDYTSNPSLRDYRSHGAEDRDGNSWSGPVGRRTLCVELQPPHSSWTQDNIKRADFVLLQNVRIKWNQKGTGTELEGNMWPDSFYVEKKCVHPLIKSDARFDAMLERRRLYRESLAQLRDPPPETKTKSRKRRKALKRAREEETAAKRIKSNGSHSSMTTGLCRQSEEEPLDARFESDSGDDSPVPKPALSSTKTTVNPHVTCAYPEVPLSKFDEIVHGTGRWLQCPDGKRIEAPFTNVKHRATLRVIDFYPHEITRFCTQELRDGNAVFEWYFWLVLTSGDVDDDPNEAINVLVEGLEAEELLGLQPTNLKTNKAAFEMTKQKLFTLWGDIEEQKEKFLRSHPDIRPDEDFSAKRYNLTADNRPFDGCILEYGVLASDQGDEDSLPTTCEGWIRLYKLFGSSIR